MSGVNHYCISANAMLVFFGHEVERIRLWSVLWIHRPSILRVGVCLCGVRWFSVGGVLVRVQRVLLQTLPTLVLCYLALCSLMFFNQRDLVFSVPPRHT